MAQWQVDSSRRSAESELIRRAVTVNGPAIANRKRPRVRQEHFCRFHPNMRGKIRVVSEPRCQQLSGAASVARQLKEQKIRRQR